MNEKKRTLLSCLMGAVMLSAVGLSACGGGGTSSGSGGDSGTGTSSVHTHTFSDEWEYDDTYHWHPATCEHTDEQGDRAEHTLVDNVCTVCGYEFIASMPEIRLIGTDNLSVVQGQTLASIGTIACMLDGRAMSSSDYTIVDETDPDAVINGSTFYSDVWGVHTIRVTATNPRDPSKVATTTFNINVYRKLLNAGSVNNITAPDIVGDADDPYSAQTIQLSGNKTNYIGVLSLDPSEYYYAEATIEGFIDAYTENSFLDWLGMAHYIVVDGDSGATDYGCRWLGSAMHATTNDVNVVSGRRLVNIIADVIDWTYYDYNAAPSYVDRDETGGTFKEFAGVAATEENPTFKYAIARVGDLFYTFVNDEFVCVYSNDYYSSVPTIPAFWARLWRTDGLTEDGLTISNIDFFGGEDAVSEKVGSLIEYGGLSAWGAGFADDCVENGMVELGEVTAEKGVNFKNTLNTGWTNNCAVELDAAFAGGFTLEFDYKALGNPNIMPDGVTPYGADAFVDFRTGSWSAVALSVGTKQGMGPTLSGFFANLGENMANENLPDGFDVSEGYHCKVTRVMDSENSKSVYTITFTSLADSSQVYTVTLEDTSANWNAVIFPVFKIRACTGEFSNITYAGSSSVAE